MSKENNILSDRNFSFVAKLLGYAFILGAGWARIEYKFNEARDQIIKKLDEHIIADGFEKQAIKLEITELKRQYAEIIEYAKSEFIRPEEVKLKRKKEQ